MLKEANLIFYIVALILGWRFGGRLSLRSWRYLILAFVWVLYPSLNFYSITSHYTASSLKEQVFLPLACFGLTLLAFILSKVLLRWYPGSDRQKATMGFLSTMGNYVFLPIPVAGHLWGDEAAHAVILASLGGDLALWTFGVSFFQKKPSLKKLISPPLVSLLIAIAVVLGSLSWPYMAEMRTGMAIVGQLTVPTAMFILGSQMGETKLSQLSLQEVMPALVIHLLLLPLLVWGLATAAEVSLDNLRVICLIAAMPCAVACAFVTKLYHGDTALAARGILLTHALALITVPVFLYWTKLL